MAVLYQMEFIIAMGFKGYYRIFARETQAERKVSAFFR